MFCDFSVFFVGSFSYLASWWIITCTTPVYICGCEGQSSMSQDDTRWKCTVSNFSFIYHSIFLKLVWSVVLDKGTNWFKYEGHRLKVKVMSTHHLQIFCISFSLLLFNEFQWSLAGTERVFCPLILLIFSSVHKRSRSQGNKTVKVVNARICKWHGIL